MPTGFTPIYQILKGGVDITGHFNDRCVMVRVDYSSGDGDDDKCFITIDDRDWLIARPTLGETLNIALGYREVGMADMGEYTIEEVTFGWVPKTMTLAGTASGAYRAMRSPIVQEYDGKNLGEIFSDIAKRGGVEAVVHPDLKGKTYEYKNVITSPYMAAQELARHFNAVAKIANGKMIVVPRGAGESASGQTIPTLVLGPAHFGTGTVKHSNRSSHGGVKASYFDRDKNIRSFVEEKSTNKDDEGAPFFVPNRIFNSIEQAKSAAKSQMRAINRSRGDADLTLATGDPWIKDQQKLLIRGMRDGVNGSYVIELASHSYTAETGIQTAIKAKPPDDAGDFESLFVAASDAQLRDGFLVPDAGGLLGSVLRDHSIPSIGGLSLR